MKRILPLIKNVEELEKEIAFEEKNILKTALHELETKLAKNDSETIEIQKKLVLKQEKDFDALNLIRHSAIENLNQILMKFIGRNFTNSDSEHWPLFSAISNSERDTLRILEIGTADGLTAVILASLFPQSEIVTIDLPQDNELFKSSYNRNTVVKEYVNQRDELINTLENITFIEMNSIKLNSWSDKSFDLIWVDGAHGYPVLPLDLQNACRLIKENGIVIVDDVFINVRKADEMYRSTAAIQTLKLFQENKLIKNYRLLRKRLGLKYNFKDLNEKFLGVIEF